MEPRRTRHSADQRGISRIEYLVLFVLIVVGLVGGWKALENRMNEHVTSRANRLDAVVSAPARDAAAQGDAGSQRQLTPSTQ